MVAPIERCQRDYEQAKITVFGVDLGTGKIMPFCEITEYDYLAQIKALVSKLNTSNIPEKAGEIQDRLYRLSVERKEDKARLREVQQWRKRLEWLADTIDTNISRDLSPAKAMKPLAFLCVLIEHGPYYQHKAVSGDCKACGAPIPADKDACIFCEGTSDASK